MSPFINIALRQNKNTLSQAKIMLGQDVKIQSCGATRLDVSLQHAHFSRTNIRRPLITESHTPSGILKVPENLFLLALRSPFNFIFSVAITPSATLFRKRDEIYLLFFNGFVYYNILIFKCQEFLKNFLIIKSHQIYPPDCNIYTIILFAILFVYAHFFNYCNIFVIKGSVFSFVVPVANTSFFICADKPFNIINGKKNNRSVHIPHINAKHIFP